MRQYLRKNSKKHKNHVTPALLACILMLSGCSLDGAVDKANSLLEAPKETESIEISETDLMVDYDENAELIDLNACDGNTLEITHAGTYVLNGTLDGQIYVDVDDELVHLILQNADVYSKSGPALIVKSASKLVLSCPEGTKNSLTDGNNYKNFEDEKSCIYTTCNLTVNGNGELYVYGYYKDAVRSKDVLKVIGTNLSVLSKNDGLRGNDGVYVATDSMNIQCENDGIRTKNDDGNVELNGGSVSIVAGNYGINSAGDISSHQCTMDIMAVVDAVHAEGSIYAE